MLQKNIYNKYIHKLLASGMLIVFALGITPRQVLHNLFANHIDTYTTVSDSKDKKLKFHKAGINCQCINLVIENPFINSANVAQVNLRNVFSSSFTTATPGLKSVPLFFILLRGPPIPA